MYKITRILLILSSISIIFSQNIKELKELKDTYDKIRVEQQADEVVKKGIEGEKGVESGPVRLIVKPGDITKYYREKMKSIQNDLLLLNNLLADTDSIRPLTDFGYNYFSIRDSIQFIDNANVSSKYILGYGDEVIISVWGQAEQYERKTLERDGTIFIDNVGLLYFGGKTQEQAKSYVLDRFSKVYSSLKSNPQLTFIDFSIGKIKNINISVAGHVKYPGNYVVNPTISIPNLLILAGGINNNGTLRNIFLQRNESIVDTLDLYPLITGVGIIDEIPIFDGDIIIVPPRGPRVAITGDVLSSAYFEVESYESVSTLLKYAGSTKYDNVDQLILSRVKGDNLLLDKADFNKNYFNHGDSLIVPFQLKFNESISISITNQGKIDIPWVKELKFNQILSIINLDKSKINNVELTRRVNNNQQKEPSFNLQNMSNFNFLPNDFLSIRLEKKTNPTRLVVVQGEVNSPGTYPLLNDKESLKSLIKRAGGLQPTSDIKNVSVKRDSIIFGTSTGNMMIASGDTIIANPILGTVRIEGEVHNPGIFEWTPKNKAKNYISLAGGLTAYGDKKHIIYITPFGEAMKINQRSNLSVLPGSKILISQKPIEEQSIKPDRFQQISSVITSLVSIAILASTTSN